MLRGLSIAVIDDDESFRIALAGSLCFLGHDAREFASADEFVATSGSGSCDRVITDLHMPGMSGLDLIRLLKARGSILPVILVTGRGEPGLDAKAAAAGAVCLLTKP